MPAKRSIRALDNAQPNSRKKSKLVCSGEQSHQQQLPETLFHGRNLRSSRQTPANFQQIARRDQAVGPEVPQKEYKQAGTPRKDNIDLSEKILKRSANKHTGRAKTRQLAPKIPKISTSKQVRGLKTRSIRP